MAQHTRREVSTAHRIAPCARSVLRRAEHTRREIAPARAPAAVLAAAPVRTIRYLSTSHRIAQYASSVPHAISVLDTA
eukprot:3941758-Rhodomonas_salina.1